MKHALAIGGTGMLATVSTWLSENGYHVSVIGRNPEKMQRLLDQNPAQLTPVLVDYTNTNELAEQLHHVQQQNGPIQLVVAWIHSNGTQVIPCLTESLQRLQSWDLFHVNSSSSKLEDIKANTTVPPHVDYHQILLGFKIESGLSRWLTHDEISNGVIEAIQENKSKNTIGTITPWEKRP
ncbi:short-chain dehydrogenase [Planococcus liqunii]|uniref:short-chain dehydrogenase n=1 Tax=Planococcus liqunii TaxID=3058394 RepID=UPI00261E3A3E|nr:short-chain dehydrogenase [Planococcus sp. N056]WKA52679.1 short-chain dehydrogenase [Planococcus sp. N056]